MGSLRKSRSDPGFRGAALTALVALAGTGLAAAVPTFWTVATQSDFLKGDVEDLSIDSDGRVFLGPSTSLVAETAAPFLWTVVAGTDGTLWAGTGNEGKVLKVSKDGKVATFFDAAELEVHAIAPAPQGGLYVATSPDGKIYSVPVAIHRSNLHHLAKIHHHDPIADVADHVQIVADEDIGQVEFRLQIDEQVQHLRLD